jgi:dipeptidyl aminopeptidase/acylaminoacyl peptidase
MRKVFLAACMTALLGLATPVVAADKPDLALYGQLPKLEQVVISPDGSKLAVITTDGEQRYLTVRKTEGGGLAGIAVGDKKLRSVTWAGENNVILVSSVAGAGEAFKGPAREYFLASNFDVKQNVQKPLMSDVKDSLNIVVGPPQVRMIKGDPVVFLEGVHMLRGVGADTLFRLNLRTNALKMLDNGVRYDTDGWLVDAQGEPVAQSMYDAKAGRWSLLMKVGSTWKTIEKTDAPMGSYGLAGFGRDGKSVLVRRGYGEDALREYRPDGQHETLPDDMVFDGLLHDPEKLNLVGGYRLERDEIAYSFFDAALQSAWWAAVKPFKDARVTLHSASKDWRRLVVRVDSPVDGPSFALVDMNTRRGWVLGPAYKGIDATNVSPVQTITYKAADGLAITGYLTLPRGREARNLPLIVLPHGGPEGRATPGYDWWSQALASRGYAVLQPNFRGSQGFGEDFIKAGFGEWGRKMQTDLSDGVHDLARQGIVDPKRVCIMGASYGGYAALAGATLDRGTYRCAVSVAGPSDLNVVRRTVLRPDRICMRRSTLGEDARPQGEGALARGAYECAREGTGPSNPGRMLAIDEDDPRRTTSMRYWLRFMGDDRKSADLKAISPAQLADQVDIPILLIHGQDDTIVPFEQSQAMADALKKAGKPVALVPLKGEDHWLSRGTTRLQMLTEAVAFVEKYNPPS